jgi:hypothetical protein
MEVDTALARQFLREPRIEAGVTQACTAPGDDIGRFLLGFSLLSGNKVHVHLAHCDPPLLPPADRESDNDCPGKDSVQAAAKSRDSGHRGIVEFQQDSHQAELSRLLVAADASVDPHRLVKFCCECAGNDGLDVPLLVPIDDEARPSSEGTAIAERLLGKAAGLLDAAGIRHEDITISDEDTDAVDQLVRSGGFDALFVCATHKEASSPVLRLAARLARLHGLTVIASAPNAGHGSWLRRLVNPLLYWSHD